MNTNEIESVIKKVVAKHVDTDGTYVFLFGSRAEGTQRRASDYDIGLYSGKPISWSVIARIKDELLEEYPIPVEIDVIDFATVTNDFKKLALREIKIWNKPKRKNSLKLI